MQARGQLHFVFPAQPSWGQIVHLFVATLWAGEPAESDEMKPVWFETNMLPFARMWDDAQIWLPDMLAGQIVSATIIVADDNETVAEVKQHHGTTRFN